MNSFITSIATWLTAHHAISLPGWGWLIAIPIALIVTIVGGFIVGYLLMAAGFAQATMKGLGW